MASYFVPEECRLEMNTVLSIRHMARFALGHVLATPGALQLLERAGIGAVSLLARHQCGDWGQVDEDDWNANEGGGCVPPIPSVLVGSWW